MINTEQLYQEVKRVWKSVYPIYFDSTKTIAEGRRIPKQFAVPEPTLQEISHAVGLCRCKNIIEPHKAYPRNFLERGRLKVEVFDKDHKPLHSNMPTKKAFMIAVGKKLIEIRSKTQPKSQQAPNKK